MQRMRTDCGMMTDGQIAAAWSRMATAILTEVHASDD
jgi:hypothetical protein